MKKTLFFAFLLIVLTSLLGVKIFRLGHVFLPPHHVFRSAENTAENRRRDDRRMNLLKAEHRQAVDRAIRRRLDADAALAADGNGFSTGRLSDIYARMAPEDAARLIETLDTTDAVRLIESMRTNDAAAILTRLKPEKAREITERMLGAPLPPEKEYK